MAKKKKQKLEISSKKMLLLLLLAILVILSAFKIRAYQHPPTMNSVEAVSQPQPNMASFDFTGQSGNVITNGISYSKARAAAILVDNSQGSGVFYNLVGGMEQNGKKLYSQPVLLNDRIKIISLKVEDPQAHDNGLITVEYLDRSEAAPMSADPTIPVTRKYAFQDDGNLIEVLH